MSEEENCTIMGVLTAPMIVQATSADATKFVEQEIVADVSTGDAVPELKILPKTVQASEASFTVGDCTYKTITGEVNITAYNGSDATITLSTKIPRYLFATEVAKTDNTHAFITDVTI